MMSGMQSIKRLIFFSDQFFFDFVASEFSILFLECAMALCENIIFARGYVQDYFIYLIL